MNIALLGFGVVGSHFYTLAKEHGGVKVTTVLSRRPRPELDCTVTADFDEIVRDGRCRARVFLSQCRHARREARRHRQQAAHVRAL